MKTIEFQKIGVYQIDLKTDHIFIKIGQSFKAALTKLDQFSHCILFTKDQGQIYCFIARILEISDKTGELSINMVESAFANELPFPNKKPPITGELVDIKPYFPCEEKVDNFDKKTVTDNQYIKALQFEGKPIGKFKNTHAGQIIKLGQSDSDAQEDISKAVSHFKAGSFLRIIWWFDRFDDKKYRDHLMCKPPYENAPRCGVFATRSPVRPNPLASTIVKVKSLDQYNNSVSILGFDGFDNSIILQIMPYEEITIDKVIVPEWVQHWTDYKVFHDIPEMNEYTHEHIDGDYSEFYFEELDNNENIESEKIDSNEIIVEEAHIHNLKNISVKIPKEKITVITGVSGSGKSSLAFDTIYHESQKQFMDLLSSNIFAESDLKDSMVKKITGLQPAIAIEQKSLGLNPRSTVASVTKIGEYIRLLFSIAGERMCPHCKKNIPEDNVCKGCGTIFFTLVPSMFNYNHPEYMCPVCKGLGEEMQVDTNLIVPNPSLSILDGASPWWGNLRKHREKPNANWMKGEVLALADDMKQDLEVAFVDLSEDFKQQIFYGSNGKPVTLNYENPNGRSGKITRPVEGVVNILQRLMHDNGSSKSIEHIDRFIVNKKCSRCHGERLLEEGRMVKLGGTRYPEVTNMSIRTLKSWCHSVYGNMNSLNREKCKDILKKVIVKLKKLEQVGLGYINLDRSIPTLSGGEAQRLKLANQFGSGLSNILYIMDEPSKGLHPRDFRFLIEAIQDLKKLKNTVIIVEHKNELIQTADYMIEIGPGAGHYGGEIIKSGNPDQKNNKDKTTISDNYQYKIKENIVEEPKLTIEGVKTNNLKNIKVNIPLAKFTCVAGVSGSGKSSLVAKTLYPAILRELGKKTDISGKYSSLTGAEKVSEIYYVSQNAIGRNSRSTPGTYTGVFDLIRTYYSDISKNQKKKFSKEHFSFNSAKGQCDYCKGAGEISVPMHFMPDIYVTCEKCKGKRYKDEILQIKYDGYSIADLLDLEIGEVKNTFINEEKIYQMLDMLCKVGLSYIKLGQSAVTLSGGEAQRIKLAKELCDSKTAGAVYIMDEPTSGLHSNDVDKLCYIISELVSKGATVIVIEHNPQIISQADYIIELGPEGGDKGGYILQEGWLEKPYS